MKIIVVCALLFITLPGKTQSNSTNQNDSIRVHQWVTLAADTAYKDSAISYLNQGLKLSQEINYFWGDSACLNALATKHRLLGHYPTAMKTAFLFKNLVDSVHSQPGLLNSYLLIGLIYSDEEDNLKCRDYYLMANQLAKAIKRADSTSILINLGDCYEKLNKLDSALYYTKKAYLLGVYFKREKSIGIALNNMGNIFSKMGEAENNRSYFDSARQYYHLALPKLIQINNDHAMVETLLGIAAMFKESGEEDSTIFYGRKALNIADAKKYNRQILLCYHLIVAHFSRVKKFDSAFNYQQKAIALSDQMFNQEKIKDLENIKFEEAEKEAEKRSDEEEAMGERRKNLQMAGIGAFIPVFFGFVLLISKRKVKSKTIRYLGLLGLLLFFEFITLLLHPQIEKLTNDTPVFMLLLLVCLAAVLLPLHHKMEHWIIEKLAHEKELK